MKNKKTQLNLEERFWKKVRVGLQDECWEWTASISPFGYGLFSKNRSCIAAHRVSWELEYNKIPDGLFVLHKCDNRKCVNPSHLFLGTQRDNMRDCKKKGRTNKPIGEKNPRSKITAYQAQLIYRLRKEIGIPLRTIGNLFGIGKSQVVRIAKGEHWRGSSPAPSA